jgi:hypothetical protein
MRLLIENAQTAGAAARIVAFRGILRSETGTTVRQISQ